MTATLPFWTEAAPRPALGSPDLPGTVDVAVVGAGVTGLTAARRLAGAGYDTLILDAAALGDGASAVNGGMAICGLKIAAAEAIARYGERLGRELWQASLDAIDLISQIAREEGIDCAFSRCGAAALGFTARDRRRFEAEARRTEEQTGLPLELVTREAIHSVVGSDRFEAALVDRVSAGLDPARYTFGLASAAIRAGARLMEHAEVLRVEQRRGGFDLSTPRGRVRAGQVLVATNGYTGTFLPALRRRVVPVGSYVVVTEPLPRETADRLIPGGRMLWTSRRFLNYFRLTPDRRLLMGGRQNLSTGLDLAESARALRSTIAGFFPELGDAAITHSWTGKLGMTFDLLPHIGRIDGIWYALGYSGHGLALGTYLGNEVGGLMAGEVERSPFAEIPHPTRWFYRRRPWFLPAAALLYRFLDRLGR